MVELPTGNLRPILDTPSEKPGMGFEQYAENIANLLKHAEEGRLTVGIFGAYGSGKSTLMNRIRKKLDDYSETEKNLNLITVEFNAWRYEHEEHLFLPLLSAIHRSEGIWHKPPLSNRFHAARHAFIKGLSLELNVGVGKVSLSGEKALDEEEELLRDQLAKASGDYVDVYYELGKVPLDEAGNIKLRIVVFIDDLDRCIPKKAFALLEQLKAVMDMRGFMFVLGLDPRAIDTFLKEKFKEDFLVSPEEYLQKMFQIPFHLPKPTEADIVELLKKALKDEQGKWLNKWAEDIANNKRLENYREYLPVSLREGKRILNMHQATMVSYNSEVEIQPDVLLALLIVQSRWPLAYWVMHTFKDDFKTVIGSCEGTATDSEIFDTIRGRVTVDVEGLETLYGNTTVLKELKDNKFASIYQTISKRLDYDPQKLKKYLEILGWPVNIEAKLLSSKRRSVIESDKE